MSKDRAAPFSRKHRRYWIPVTGGMILIGIINIAIGYCTYSAPSDIHERIIVDVPYARGMLDAGAAPRPAVGCPAAITARVESDLPGGTIVACTPDRVTVVRSGHTIELALSGGEIREVDETLTLPEIPPAVMRAFAVAYPRTIPARAIKHSRRGGEPRYELAFPPGAAHAVATLGADGTVLELR